MAEPLVRFDDLLPAPRPGAAPLVSFDDLLSAGPSASLPALTGQQQGVTAAGRPIMGNADGSVSTERSITIQRPDGLWTNVPSMYDGREVPDDEAAAIAERNGWKDSETGREFGTWPTVDAAVSAARARSQDLGATVGVGVAPASKAAPLVRFDDLMSDAPAGPSVPVRFDVPAARGAPVVEPPRASAPGQGGGQQSLDVLRSQVLGRGPSAAPPASEPGMQAPDDLMATGGASDPGTAGRVMRDVGAGIMEAPGQVVGGVRDAWQEAAEALESAASWAGEQTGIRPLSGAASATDAALPEVAGPESTTGGLIRGAAQFVAGFAPAAKALQVGRAVTTAGQFVRASGAGALADATVFDPHEARLSNLIQEQPALRNPVTEYLAASPADSEAEGRFKNALEGLGLGTVAEGVFQGVRAIRAGRRVREAAPSPNDGGTAANSQPPAGVVARTADAATPAAPGSVAGASQSAAAVSVAPGARPGGAMPEIPASLSGAGEMVPGSPVMIRDPAMGDLPAGKLDGKAGRIVEIGDNAAIVEIDGVKHRVGKALISSNAAPDPAAGRVGGEPATAAPAAPVPKAMTTVDYLGGLTPERLRTLGMTADDDTRRMIRDELRNRGVDVPAVDDVTLPSRDLAAAPPSVAENQRRGLAAIEAARRGETVPAAMYRDELGAIAFDLHQSLRNLPEEVARTVGPRLVRAISVGDLRGRPASGSVKVRIGDAGDTVTLKVREVQGRETWSPVSIDMGGGKVLDLTPPSVATVSADPRDLRYELTTESGRRFAWRGPVDVLTWLRTQGGLWDDAGELRALGLENKARMVAPREGFLGPLVRGDLADRRAAQLGLPDAKKIRNPESGLTFDDAALRAWEAGYFGAREDRPTIKEFLDLLDRANRADNVRDLALREDDRAAVDAMMATGREDVDEVAFRMGLDIGGMDDAAAASHVYSEMGRSVTGPEVPLSMAEVEGIASPAGLAISDKARSALDAMNARGPTPKVERAGNIRLNSLNTVEDIRRAITTAAEQNDEFKGARRDVVKDEALSALADDLGMTVDTLAKRKVGQALNGEELMAARRLLADSGENLVRVAKAARGGSDDALMAFNEAWTRHVAIQEQVSGATAEAGRALRSMRLQAASERQRLQAVRELINAKGGRDRIEDLADKVASLAENPKALNQFSRNAFFGGGLDKLREYWINALLSGPTTHVVNTTSNALTFLWSLPEDALAAAIGGARRSVGLGSPERVFASEAAARVFGIVEGARDGFRAAAKAAWTGEAWDNQFAKLEGGYGDAIGGKLGKVIRVPTRMLQSEDSFFKALAFRTELNAAAVNKAAREGLKGAAFARRVADLRANPSADMLERSIDRARVLTFTNPTGEVGNAISMLRRIPPFRWVLPFVKTPFNILRFAARRSVFAPAVKAFREDMAAGGARRDRAAAELVLGNAAALTAYSYAVEGLITGGGPSDPKERQALFATGWQPYSMKIGDKWVSYDRLDPLGLLIGTAADFAEVVNRAGEEDATDLAAGLAMSFATTLRDKSYLRGLSDALNALDDPERYAGNWLRNFAGSFVPNVVGQYTRASDPVLRETRTLADTIQARLPGSSETLFPKRDVWGEPVERSGGLFGDSTAARIFSPVRVTDARVDPITTEVLRLEITPTKAARQINGVDLTPAQFDRYQQLTGRFMRRIAEGVINSPGYSRMVDPARRLIVNNVMGKAREAAREGLLAEFPEIERLAIAERNRAMAEGRKRERVEQ